MSWFLPHFWRSALPDIRFFVNWAVFFFGGGVGVLVVCLFVFNTFNTLEHWLLAPKVPIEKSDESYSEIFVCDESLLCCYFQKSSVFDIQMFDYNVSQCKSLWVHFSCGLLNFLDIYNQLFYQICKVFIFKYYPHLSLSILLLWLPKCICLFDGVTKIS